MYQILRIMGSPIPNCPGSVGAATGAEECGQRKGRETVEGKGNLTFQAFTGMSEERKGMARLPMEGIESGPCHHHCIYPLLHPPQYNAMPFC